MKLCFDTVEELRAFVKDELKGKRGGGKNDTDDAGPQPSTQAPAPLQPPAGGAGVFQPQQQAPSTFNPGVAPGQFQPQGSVTVDPNVMGLVQRINTKIDGAVAGGQPVDQVLTWFRGQCVQAGLDAANATMDQIKQIFLLKLPVPSLEQIAKLMNA